MKQTLQCHAIGWQVLEPSWLHNHAALVEQHSPWNRAVDSMCGGGDDGMMEICLISLQRMNAARMLCIVKPSQPHMTGVHVKTCSLSEIRLLHRSACTDIHRSTHICQAFCMNNMHSRAHL